MARRRSLNAHFNSRPSARGDISQKKGETALYHFNSRPSARGDITITCERRYPIISIHAPPRGATFSRLANLSDMLFQFTPLREGRRFPPIIHSFYHTFQFTPLREGRRKRYAISANLLFNPYKSAWLNNRATQFVEIILVIFHRIIA